MLKVRLFLVSILCIVVLDALAYTCLGACELGKEAVDNLNSAGDVVLKGTKVAGNAHVAGKLTAVASHMEGLTVAGKTALDNTTIDGSVKIAGKLIAHNSTFKDDTSVAADAEFTNSTLNEILKIAGKAELENTHVNGATKVAGMLIAKRSVFNDDVKISSDKAVFNNSKLNKDLTIESKNTMATVELVCGTMVKGKIIFKGKAGIVKVEQPTKVNLKIENGKLEQSTTVNCVKDK